MSETSPVKAPKLTLDERGQVIDRDTGAPVKGIVVLSEQAPHAEPTESAYATVRRWGQFRQALVKPRL